MRPEGTTVKAISGGCYVYETRNERRADGTWRTVSGRCVGKIDPARGFVLNSGSLRDKEVSALDFGEWAVALANPGGVLALLREHFSARDAERIYAVAVVHFVQGLTYMRDVASFYEMSALQLLLPGLRLGYDALDASGLGVSMPEMLVEARKVKAARRNGVWVACNCKKKRVDFFKKLNTPLELMPQK